jgi:hypothetical protein
MVGLGGLFWLGPGCLVLQLLADCVYVVQLLMKRKPYSLKKKKNGILVQILDCLGNNSVRASFFDKC